MYLFLLSAVFSKVFMGYYTNWSGLPVSSIPWYLTHLSYAFAQVGPDGTVSNFDPVDVGNPSGCNAGGLYYEIYKLKQTRPWLKNILSIGGWTFRDTFYPVMSDPVKRAKFVSSSITLAMNYGFDGNLF
eukprot:NODE_204_length_12954_cov_1.347880.p9 type:complete len:129 gc:universal NODE_204_length_12954_cov_1.347880:11680-12066(+)